MTITASICSDINAMIILFIIIWFAKKNPIGDKHKNRVYISMVLLTIVILMLEISTVLMSLSNNSQLVVPHRIANVLGFALSPVVPFILLHSHKEGTGLKKRFQAIPLVINIVMCILSYRTGWIFFVDEQNHYVRGKLFLIPMIISAFYFVMLMVHVRNKIVDDKNENQKLIIFLYVLPFLGSILQIASKNILLIWGSVSIALVFYYLLLRELQFRHDVQTGIKNRLAFEKAMDKYTKSGKSVAIVVLDINNLKSINDRYGHMEGDRVIHMAARIIQQSFIEIGDAYRIGGDEFCVICEGATEASVNASLKILERLLSEINQDRTVKIEVAYGYDFFSKSTNESIDSIFSKADCGMYDHKAKSKGLYG